MHHLPWPQPPLISMLLFVVVKLWFKKTTTHNIKFIILTIFNVQFNGVKYIHIVVKQVSKTFSSYRAKTPHSTPKHRLTFSPPPSPLTAMLLLFLGS